MAARRIMIGILFVPALVWPRIGEAQPSYYNVYVSLGDNSASGYAELDERADGSVIGKLCAYDDLSPVGSPKQIANLGTAKIEGRRHSNTLTVKFSLDQVAERTKLKTILPSSPATLTRSTTRPEINLGDLLGEGPGWQTSDVGERKADFTFVEIRNDLKTEPRDRYAQLSGPRFPPPKFDLTRFDGLSPKQAFSLVINTKWDENISPTVVHLIYKPSNRDKITEFLKQFGDLVEFEGPAPPDCGAPFIEGTIAVPALLEFYFARKLQASGLVARAYPEELVRTPPFIPIPLRNTELTNAIKDQTMDFADKQLTIATFLDKQVHSFVAAVRPKFQGPWQIILRKSGVPFIYRWEIVGASISSCTSNEWEKFDMQIALSLSEKLEVALQVLDAYLAPGSLAKRPSDERFKDNPINDDRMQKIQDAFYDFLVRQGVGFKNPDFPVSSTAACTL